MPDAYYFQHGTRIVVNQCLNLLIKNFNAAVESTGLDRPGKVWRIY